MLLTTLRRLADGMQHVVCVADDPVVGQQREPKAVRGQDQQKFRGLDVEGALELLAILDAATSLRDLSPLASVALHRLKGDRKGQWAMTVSGPWRICFRFERGDAHSVEIVDYHTG